MTKKHWKEFLTSLKTIRKDSGSSIFYDEYLQIREVVKIDVENMYIRFRHKEFLRYTDVYQCKIQIIKRDFKVAINLFDKETQNE